MQVFSLFSKNNNNNNFSLVFSLALNYTFQIQMEQIGRQLHTKWQFSWLVCANFFVEFLMWTQIFPKWPTADRTKPAFSIFTLKNVFWNLFKNIYRYNNWDKVTRVRKNVLFLFLNIYNSNFKYCRAKNFMAIKVLMYF